MRIPRARGQDGVFCRAFIAHGNHGDGQRADTGGVWGKIIGGMAGFALGGPFGALVGAAFGHAADQGGFAVFQQGVRFQSGHAPRFAGGRDQAFAIGVVVLAARLARCDGPVKRAEIDAFKRSFRIPPEAVRDVGRLFDHARDGDEDPAAYAATLGAQFGGNPGMLEDVLTALFAIARADGPVNRREEQFLRMAWGRFGLDEAAWERAREGRSRHVPASEQEDPYAVLGVSREAGDDALRAAWRQLMRENHPDSLASQGAGAEAVRRAGEKVARINAAWDRIKRERGL
jgi:DnaJ like chaperone protein